MINASLEQFLDTGWFSEATLYYNGYTYWCEGGFEDNKDKKFHFFVYKYKASLVEENGEIWSRRVIIDDDVVDYSLVLDIWGNGENEVKELFLQSRIFDGKTFWEVEKNIAWYDEYYS